MGPLCCSLDLGLLSSVAFLPSRAARSGASKAAVATAAGTATALLMAATGVSAAEQSLAELRLSAPRTTPLVASVRAEDSQLLPGRAVPNSLALLSPEAAPGTTRYAITPERRALLNTIRFAEGTWARGEDLGYRILFGGGLMATLERHPDRVNYSGGYASAAAGAYQFMPFTWARASRALQLNGFGPHVQDQAALFLIERRGALPLADQGLFTPELAARLAPEWASFPTLAGRSYYGQPVQRYGVLRSFYERNLADLRAAAGAVQEVAKAPACEPADSLRCQLESLDRLGPRSRTPGS
jgi:muramidase (phage lysozyme)